MLNLLVLSIKAGSQLFLFWLDGIFRKSTVRFGSVSTLAGSGSTGSVHFSGSAGSSSNKKKIENISMKNCIF